MAKEKQKTIEWELKLGEHIHKETLEVPVTATFEEVENLIVNDILKNLNWQVTHMPKFKDLYIKDRYFQ